MLERVLLSAVAALFVAFGLVMLLRQLDTSLTRASIVHIVLYPSAFVFGSQMLNCLMAKHNGSICLSASALTLSDQKASAYVIVPFLLTVLVGTIASFLYGTYGNEHPLFGITAIICFLTMLGWEEYCRSRRFRQVLSISDINEAGIVPRRRRRFVRVSHKKDWISLPYIRNPEQLLEAINAMRKKRG